ncbi:MAG: carboxymethylenebutenolidase, partial [Rhizobiales bacterium 65-9]
DFLDQLTILAGGATAATAALAALQSDYAQAQTVRDNDPRLTIETVSFPSGSSKIDGYLARPADATKRPAVIVIHENRGLNPHIKDIARRIALAGFIAFAPDYLTALGGTPADEDKARDLFPQLKPADVVASSRAVVAGLKARADSTGKVGAIGFCWGGGQVNALAVADPTLDAGVAYYGGQPRAEDVAAIKAPLMLHYAGLDERINAGIPAYEAALRQNDKTFELFIYPNVNHAFNNDTGGARYDKTAADLAWGRTIGFLRKYLGDAPAAG